MLASLSRSVLTALILALLGSSGRAAENPRLELLDDRLEPVSALTAGDSLVVTVDGLEAARGYELTLLDGNGTIHGFVRAATDAKGRLGPELIWYHSGITGTDPAGDGVPGPGFRDREEAERHLLATSWELELRRVATRAGVSASGQLVAGWDLPVRRAESPRFSVTDFQGRLRSSFEVGREAVYLEADGIAPGMPLEVWIVADRSSWKSGDLLENVTDVRRTFSATTGRIGPIWSAGQQRVGRYDVVVRPAPARRLENRLRDVDIVLYGLDAGLVIRPALTSLASAQRHVALSGRVLSEYPFFEHRSIFLRGGVIAAAVDPSDLRQSGSPDATVFRWAAIHVVEDKNPIEWLADPTLNDVTEVVEIRPVKFGTLEVNSGPVWSNPEPAPAGPNGYDVVIDLGARPLGGPPQFDGQYTAGIDILDGAIVAGLRVLDDPSQPGPFPVGRARYDFPDAADLAYGAFADRNVDIRAVVAYPGETAGEDVPMSPGKERFPLVVILHGNHAICNVGSGCSSNCAPSNRIPNHEGYDYLLDLWASHGFIAVSADGFDVTCKNNRYLERGAVILEHLKRWDKWNQPFFIDGTFNGRFRARVEMRNIALIGHSRGGEGAVAAQIINQNVDLGWDIRCVVAIAPTDQNTSNPPGGGPRSFVLGDTPFFNMMGSSDGDVTNMQGARLFDRAAPGGQKADKSQVFIYGANHNSWNTIWIDPSWNFGGDDGVGIDRISDEKQQLAAKVYITAWLKAWCMGEQDLLAIHQNRLHVPELDGVRSYWSYEATDHLDVDDFQNGPADPSTNSLGGVVTVAPPPEDFLESSFRPGAYDGSFYHDTLGLILGWRQATFYETEVPVAQQDVSAFSHLALRVAIIHDVDKNPVLGAGRLEVNLEDGAGRRQSVELGSEAFDPIPYPYPHPGTSWKTMLSSVRVPLRSFRQDGSDLDLTQIRKIVIRLPKTGLFAIDDIQFTR